MTRKQRQQRVNELKAEIERLIQSPKSTTLPEAAAKAARGATLLAELQAVLHSSDKPLTGRGSNGRMVDDS